MREPKCVLEAEIENYAHLTRSRTDTYGHSNARHDLQPIAKIMRPPHPWADVETMLRSNARSRDLRGRSPHCLQQRVEAVTGLPHGGLPKVHTQGAGTLVQFVLRARHPRRA